MSAQELITDHLDLWTSTVTHKSGSGRSASGKNGKIELTGIKKLRELILELAVRGKLVEQDPSDEPASVLLDRIAEEKARLVKEGKIKKPKKSPEISEEEKPFELPDGWSWTRLGNITSKIGSGATPRGGKNAYTEYGIPFLRSQNIWNDGLSLQEVAYIPKETHEKMANTHVSPNDILLNITGASLGRCAVVPESLSSANVSQHVTIIRTTESVNRDYLHAVILSPYVQGLVWGRQVGMAREGLSKKVLELFEIPIPPEAEQHRIVEKVDELMVLCNRLEQQAGDQLEAHEVLVDTLLDALTRSPDAAELAENWARVAEHFDSLFTTEASIEKLKQTILQLAMMGRLVPQDPNDEPASMLLDKIAEEKDRLVKEGQIKKPKKLPKITEEERPFDAPPSWAFTRVAELYELQNGYAFKSEWFSQSGIKLLRNINISHGEADWSECAHLPESMASDYQKFSLDSGDLVISLDRPLISTGLKYAIIKKKDLPCLLLQRVARFQPYSDTIATHYLERWINSKMFKNSIDPGRSNGVPHISTGQIGKLILPLPPKNEQYRIVEKVDELMALCDQLKARLNVAGETRAQMAETVVERAVN